MPPTFVPMEAPVEGGPPFADLGPATAARAALRQQVAARAPKGAFKKFKQVLQRAGREGAGKSALRAGASALDFATFGALPGAGRVSLLRGLGGLGALGALGYMAAAPTYDILKEETDVFGPSGRAQRASQLAADLQDVGYQSSNRAAYAARLLEAERMKQSIRQNMADIAQNSPALYNQVSAGRRLPRGAVVLGGQPRQDLLMELARAVDSGAFQKQDPLSDLMG